MNVVIALSRVVVAALTSFGILMGPGSASQAPKTETTLLGYWISTKIRGENSGAVRQVVMVFNRDGSFEESAILQFDQKFRIQTRSGTYQQSANDVHIQWNDGHPGSPQGCVFQARFEGSDLVIQGEGGEVVMKGSVLGS